MFWRRGAWSGVPGVGARCGNGLFSTYKSPKFYLSFTILVSFILVPVVYRTVPQQCLVSITYLVRRQDPEPRCGGKAPPRPSGRSAQWDSRSGTSTSPSSTGRTSSACRASCGASATRCAPATPTRPTRAAVCAAPARAAAASRTCATPTTGRRARRRASPRGAFGPRGELEGPGVLCAGGGGDEAGGAACAGGVYAGRFRSDSLARGTLADPAAAEERRGLRRRPAVRRPRRADRGRDDARRRVQARRVETRAQRTGSAEAARAARGAAQAAKAAAALLHDQAVWTKRRSRCMLCAPPDGDLRAPAPSGRTTGAGLWYLWPWTSPLWLCLAAFALLAAWAYRLRRLAAPGRRVRRPPPAARAPRSG